MISFPSRPRIYWASFRIDDVLYMGPIYVTGSNTEESNTIILFDPIKGRSHNIDFKGVERRKACNFLIGKYGYFLGGVSVSEGQLLRDIWKFDPSK